MKTMIPNISENKCIQFDKCIQFFHIKLNSNKCLFNTFTMGRMSHDVVYTAWIQEVMYDVY